MQKKYNYCDKLNDQWGEQWSAISPLTFDHYSQMAIILKCFDKNTR